MLSFYFKVVTPSLAIAALAATGFGQGIDQAFGGGADLTPMLISGKVVLDDGTPPMAMVPIELVCHGEPRLLGLTDSRGYFNVEIGGSHQTFGDASVASARGFKDLLVGSNSGGTRGRALADCDVRASLAGFRSDAVSLTGRGIMDRPDLGSIVLYRMANVEGFTISATSGLAPKNARSAYEKGLAEVRKRKFEQAGKEFEKAVEGYPKYAAAWFELGRIQEQLGKPEAARQAYGHALAADSKYIEPYERLSMLAVKESKWQDVAGATDRIIHLNPYDFPSAYYFNAIANLELGQLDAAEKSGREALKLVPARQNPKLNYVLGLILAQKRVFTESAEFLRSFLNNLPKGMDGELVRKQLDIVERMASH